jgi:hypothetical protein
VEGSENEDFEDFVEMHAMEIRYRIRAIGNVDAVMHFEEIELTINHLSLRSWSSFLFHTQWKTTEKAITS